MGAINIRAHPAQETHSVWVPMRSSKMQRSHAVLRFDRHQATFERASINRGCVQVGQPGKSIVILSHPAPPIDVETSS